MNLIYHVIVVGVYQYLRRHSDRDVPDICPFSHGIMSIKSLEVI